MKKLDLMMIGGGVALALGPFARAGMAMDASIYYGFQAEQFEYRVGDESEKRLVWDADAFVGTDELKLRWQGEGERDLDAESYEKLENRFVLQTPISDFFDAKGGVRVDTPEGADRWYGTVGIVGLAPQWFEVDADLFVSETGDGSARLDVEYEGLLTNRLILTPSFEINAAFSEDREIEIGKGISSAEFGLRLSYDLIDRAIVPYVGVAYERKFGDTADFAKHDGEDYEATYIVTGIRLMF
ncbi:copper resistance protein B [Thalassospira sp. MBR-102]|uniref:copper resistance protein B n=1 Tax=Thalassospira sp. MBR-102 TaxID=3156466 RepID=UPI003394B55F